MKMRIVRNGSVRGQKMYTVTDGQDRLFTGALDEVKRFVIVHNEKVRVRREAAEALLASIRCA
jgi:hypothetical protein